MEFPLLPARPHDSHKGLFGNIGLIGGAPGMVGALLLAARAALKCGAGRVTLGILDDAIHVDAAFPELMFSRPEQLITNGGLTVLAIGPGLGQSRLAVELMETALCQAVPLVIDADGLNVLAAHAALAAVCATRSAPTVLTPHPGEAARLLQTDPARIQSRREASAREIAARYNTLVALKGAGTVLSATDGKMEINPTGNPSLSAPGMGDVLTGMLAAFLARLPPWEALHRAVWLHGQAAMDAVAQGVGPEGLMASELTDFVRLRLNRDGDS
jgi:ADP-dependent NAD(P)H-hydrate dehydratase / NAD(P)H-hydrate epimerase